MCRKNRLWNSLCILLLMDFLAQSASAEIYKWVDQDGNTHFGVKPRDAVIADQAVPVDLVESYQPAVPDSKDQEAFDKRQAAIRRKTALFRKEQAAEKKAEQAERKKRNIEFCAALNERIERLSAMHSVDGKRVFYYAVDEKGNSVSAAQQKKIVLDLRAQYMQAGCR